MSWLFSRALVAGYSAAYCSGGELSAQLNVMPTPQPFLLSGKTTAFSSRSQFGLTCELLTAARGGDVLMWFLAAFPAKTSAAPALAPVSTESDPACGWRWPGSFAKYDPATPTWKTRQCSLLGGLVEFSETWPRWGWMRNGECSALTKPAHLTSATESGSWPTPRRTDADRGGRGDLLQAVRGNTNPHFKSWPTPTVKGNYNRKGLSAKSGDGLATAVKRWPTPHGFSKDGRSNGPSGNELGRAVNQAGGDGGSLNPDWVEWLMGWPIGWTALRPLETDRFREWLQLHGSS